LDVVVLSDGEIFLQTLIFFNVVGGVT